jgi:hypothetical protein
VAVTSKEKICCVDGPIIALLTNGLSVPPDDGRMAKHVVGLTSEEEKKICCVDGPVIALLTNGLSVPPDDGRMAETCCGSNIGKGEEELLR